MIVLLCILPWSSPWAEHSFPDKNLKQSLKSTVPFLSLDDKRRERFQRQQRLLYNILCLQQQLLSASTFPRGYSELTITASFFHCHAQEVSNQPKGSWGQSQERGEEAEGSRGKDSSRGGCQMEGGWQRRPEETTEERRAGEEETRSSSKKGWEQSSLRRRDG